MLIFASGCKYDNTVSKYVYNYSNDTITVQTNTETFNLKPAEFRLVQTNEYKDQREAVPCGEHIEFTLTFSSGRTLIKAIDSTDAWEGNIGGDNHLFQECYFKIYEVDLQ